jgi:hypothetical protein
LRPGLAIPAALAGLLVLSGCEEVPPPAEPPAAPAEPAPPPAPPPPSRPAPPPAPEPPAAPSAQSEALALYYRRLQADLLSQGLLRGDGGGTDAPFTDTMLARNFLRIALYDEYSESSAGTMVPEARQTRLRRWDQPIRMEIIFGPSVPAEQAARDRASIAAYGARLSRLTGVPISQVESGGNFHVAVLSEDDRRAFEPRLRALVPGIADSSVRAFMNLPRSTLCLVIAFGEEGRAGYGRAVALIRAEHPNLLRSACIHEELAQGMGLANDSPQARPSIFNDDEEFALLTRHDELLLRILYDRRLRTGMTLEEAEPVVRQIATELMGGGPS